MYPKLKIVTTAFCCVLLLNSLAQSTMTYNDPDTEFKQAKEFYQKGEYSLAYTIFKHMYSNGVAVSNYPVTVQLESKYYYILCGLYVNDAAAEVKAIEFIELEHHTPRIEMLCFELGEFYYRRKDFGNAIIYYNKTSIENLSNVAIAAMKFHKAYAQFTLQQFAEAKPLFNTVRQIPNDPNYIDANYYYGFISFYEKNYKEALTAFQIAEKQPMYQNVIPFYIAEIYYFNRESDKAISYAEGYIQKGGQFYDLQLKQLTGHLLFEKKEYKRALVYLQEYVRKSEKVTRQDLYELSYCYYEAGAYVQSIEGFKQLGGKEDSLAQNSMYLLADAYLKTNQKANARNAFLFCQSNNSNYTQKEISAFSYAKLSYELNYLDVALKELQEFIVLYPKSKNTQEAKELLVAVLSNTSNYVEALALFEKLQNPSENARKIYPRILYGRAVEEINDQHISQADDLLTHIMQLPFNRQQLPYTFFWKGEIAYRTGKLNDAVTYLTNYLKDAKVNGEVNPVSAKYTLGYCLLKRGDYKAALPYFQSVYNNNISATATDIEQDAYVRSADCYYMTLQYKQALKMYDDVLTFNLKSADYALYQKAIIAGAQNNGTEKIALLSSLLQRYPASSLSADASLEVANSYLADEKFNAALVPLQAILKNSQASAFYPQAFLKTGVAYFNLNKNEEALTNFTRVVKQYPNSQESDEAIEYIRNIFVENQKPSEFVAFMQKNGKNITTNEADSLTYKSASLRYDAQDFAGAITGFANYLNTYPDGKYAVEANYFAAEINITNKDVKKAATYYSNVAAKAPNKYAECSTLQLARIDYFDLKDYPNAEKNYTLLKSLATQQENKLEAMRGLLRCQYRMQKWKDAVANAQDLLQEKGSATNDKMIANMVVAKSYQADSLLDKASSFYQAVVVLGKSEYSAEAMYRLAEILLLQSKLPEAEKAAFDVIKKAGSYELWVTKSYLLLGDIYVKEKDLFNAEATFKSIADNATIPELKQEADAKLAQVISLKNNNNKVEPQ